MHAKKILALILALIIIFSLSLSPALAQGDESDPNRPDGWTTASHSRDADANFDVVFPTDTVNTLTITIDPDTWQAMLDNMTDLQGEFGARQDMQLPGMGGDRPAGGQPPEGFDPDQLPADGAPQGGVPGQMPAGGPPGGFAPGGGRPPMGGGPGGGMMGGDDSQNPMWVEVTVEFNGQVWTHVGMRFKGNSSLMSTWGTGSYKLPFKLDFDEWEDLYPEIDNQRFFGFKQLSFSSNWSDDSLLRERVTADVFRAAGVPSAHTAFYAVYIDYGEGPVYFGLYTAVEVIDDTVIETQFDDDDGNVYKPEGAGATFAAGSFNETSFDLETNQDEADYSDVLALYDALHAATRLSDPAAWRAGLEAVLDVDGFLNWLAVNTLVQNWDTYGVISHNYYLYHDPDSGLLTWIPWDNNMALTSSVGMGNTLSFEMTEVDESWPLIRYLLDDDVYYQGYLQHLAAALAVFGPAQMTATYESLHDLIAPYVAAETAGYTLLSSPEAFAASVDELVAHVTARYDAAAAFLASEGLTVP